MQLKLYSVGTKWVEQLKRRASWSHSFLIGRNNSGAWGHSVQIILCTCVRIVAGTDKVHNDLVHIDDTNYYIFPKSSLQPLSIIWVEHTVYCKSPKPPERRDVFLGWTKYLVPISRLRSLKAFPFFLYKECFLSNLVILIFLLGISFLYPLIANSSWSCQTTPWFSSPKFRT